jgi:hypothetical protein
MLLGTIDGARVEKLHTETIASASNGNGKHEAL